MLRYAESSAIERIYLPSNRYCRVKRWRTRTGLTRARALSPIEDSTSQTDTPCSLVREANKWIIFKGPVKPRSESTTLSMGYHSNVRLREMQEIILDSGALQYSVDVGHT